MARLIIDLPAAMYEQLQQRAQAAGQSPEALSRELLAAALQTAPNEPPAVPDNSEAAPQDAPKAPRSAREILKAAGHLVELSPAMEALIIPGVTLEEVQDELSKAGGPSLSDIILEQRGPKV